MSDPGWYQRKFGRNRAPAQYPQQPPTHTQVSPYQQQAPPRPTQSPGQIRVTIENLWDSMHHWQGGKAHRVDRQPCPECGSNQFYSRSSEVRRGPPPACHCYNCGYNGGLFEQGDPTRWGASG